jgi:hypothetical protein
MRGVEYSRLALMGVNFPCSRSTMTTPRSFANGVFPTQPHSHYKTEKEIYMKERKTKKKRGEEKKKPIISYKTAPNE